jgi:tetratricopeptide (TPR) repeat protein
VKSSNEPFKLSNREAESVQFLALNLDSFIGLANFADLSVGFTIGFAEVNFSRDADLLITALPQRPECQDIQFAVLNFPDPRLRFLLEELKQILPTIQVEAGKKLVLILRGLENAIGVSGDYPPILADLNLVRDAFAVQVPHPIIFILPDYAITRIARYARDFWAWTSGVFKFNTVQETLETAYTQALGTSRFPGNDLKPVKQERIDLLQRLLMDYAPSGQDISNPNKRTCITILRELGDAYRSLADYAKARPCYQQAWEFAVELDDRQQQADLLLKIGLALPSWDNAPKALEYYNQALEYYQAIGDRLGEANTLQAIGDVLQFLKRSDEALERYEAALQYYQAIGDRLGEANTLQAIGQLQEPNTALEYYQDSQNLYVQIGDRYSQSRNLLFIAEALSRLGQRDKAITSLTQAATLAEEINFNPLKQHALERLAELSNDEARSA